MNRNDNGYRYRSNFFTNSFFIILFLSFERKTQIELWICFYAVWFIKVMMFFHHSMKPQVLVCIFSWNFITFSVMIFFLLFDLPIFDIWFGSGFDLVILFGVIWMLTKLCILWVEENPRGSTKRNSWEGCIFCNQVSFLYFNFTVLVHLWLLFSTWLSLWRRGTRKMLNHSHLGRKRVGLRSVSFQGLTKESAMELIMW
jgi:hypothetical protein